MEHRMRCKVCGKIWCFTDADQKKNLSNMRAATLSAIGGIASGLGGTTTQQHLSYDMMERSQAKVVDFYQCPNCHSRDVERLSEEEWNEVQLKESFANARVSINANATTEALLSRVKLLLEDKDWPNANAYCDAVLDTEPENAVVYVYKLMAELRVSKQADLANHKVPFDTKSNYQKALRFADDILRQTLKGYIDHINERNEQERLDGLYSSACAAMQQSATEEAYKNAASLFEAIKGYKDADSLQAECLEKAEQARLAAERKANEEKAAKAKKIKKVVIIAASIVVIVVVAFLAGIVLKAKARQDAYNTAVALVEAGRYDEALAALTELLEDYQGDVSGKLEALYEAGRYDELEEALATFSEREDYKAVEELRDQVQAEVDCQEQYDRAISQMNAGDFESAIKSFQKLGDYKDSVTLVEKASEELYTAALDYYRSGKPISLPIAWNNFNKYPSDYKDTKQFKDEIDGILKQLAGRYIKRGGDSAADENFVVILYDDGDGFDIDYSSLSSYKYFNYLTTTIAWLIEDGQAIYGNISLKQGELTVTLVDGGIYIDTDVHEELNGTYLKQ